MNKHLLITLIALLAGCSQKAKIEPDQSQSETFATSEKDKLISLSKYTVEELKETLASRRDKTLSPKNQSPELLQATDSEILNVVLEKEKALYGPVDRRKDYCDIQDPKKLLVANSVAAIVSPDHFTEVDGAFRLLGSTLQTEQHLCSGESFEHQIVAASCTSFVVSSRMVATAGHCVDGIKSSRIVFGFRTERDAQNGVVTKTSIPAADVYTPVEVVAKMKVDNGVDYALVKVDRDFSNHPALALNLEGKISVDEAVYVLGFPSGLPLKMADRAFVRAVSPKGYFVSNLDTFGGNSGSPVLNSNTHRVEGILVRGETDYGSKGGCKIAYVCPSITGCRGEESTLISVLSDLIKANKSNDPVLVPITKSFSSGPRLSGAGNNYSGEYVVYSDPAPDGFRISDYSGSLNGDRSCGSWATCRTAIEGNRVAFRFQLQGHNEWPPPGQATSEGTLIVTYGPMK